jgi:hypothetical protein
MLGGMHAKGKGQIGAIVTGRTMARIEGGYIINGVDLPHGKGFVPEENNLAIGSEILAWRCCTPCLMDFAKRSR